MPLLFYYREAFMRAIVFTSDKGKKYTTEEIEKQRETVKQQFLQSSTGYVEIIGTVGRLNSSRERIEEHCYIIESLENFNQP